MAERDFLDEIIEERTKENPDFPEMLKAAARRRELLRTLAEQRGGRDRSQTAIAALMESSQSAVARLEGTASDALVSTVQRYARAVGFDIQYHLVPVGTLDDEPGVVVHDAQ